MNVRIEPKDIERVGTAERDAPVRGRKILVMGLPGAGKTTLSRVLRERLRCPHFNADEVRTHLYTDLGFSSADRIEHARRMGWLCDRVTAAGTDVIADFICPTPETREAFGRAFTVWVDRIRAGRFEDTNRLFTAPVSYNVRVTAEGSPETWADLIASEIGDSFVCIEAKGNLAP